MSSLDGRRIVLGVSGGIAAYKAVEVCRRLVDAGAHVVAVPTEAALRFVGRTTFDALGSERARVSLFDDADPIPHTTLGQQADLIIVAPATARIIGAYAAGISDDLLSATLLATRAPVVVCPAMHTEMWEHPAVQDNLATLVRRGVIVVPPEEGTLAGGDSGAGRLAEPTTIVSEAERVLTPASLADLSVVVTAGGTREAIDPVRYIGNRSSGKQGHAIAAEAAARGARVTLITTARRPSASNVEVVGVTTAAEMRRAVLARADADIVVMAAAVADFRPVVVADEKIKKSTGDMPKIELEPTDDILAELGAAKRQGQTLVGFAAETTDLVGNAQSKLEAKHADLLVANDISAPGAGFEGDTNEVTLLRPGREHRTLPRASKRAVARAVLDAVEELRSANP